MFGEPAERVHRQTIVVRLVLALFVFLPPAALFVLAGIAELNKRRHPWPYFGIALGVAVAFAWVFWAIGRTTVSIHPEGVCRRTIFSAKAMRWDEILEYRYKSTLVAAGGTLGAVGGVIDAYGARTGTNRSLVLTLISRDGRRLELNSNLRLAAEAIDIVLSRVHARTMPDLERRLEAGETLRFGKVELSVGGVCEAGDARIPLDQISSVEILGTRLRIKRGSDYFAAVSVDTTKVPNVVALLELLRLRGVAVPDLRPKTTIAIERSAPAPSGR